MAHYETELATAILERAQQCGNVCGVVLPVAIERHDPVRVCGPHAVEYGHALPATDVVTQESDLRHRRVANGRETFDGCIAARVIDKDDLELTTCCERLANLTRQSLDVARFITHGNDDAHDERLLYRPT